MIHVPGVHCLCGQFFSHEDFTGHYQTCEPAREAERKGAELREYARFREGLMAFLAHCDRLSMWPMPGWCDSEGRLNVKLPKRVAR